MDVLYKLSQDFIDAHYIETGEVIGGAAIGLILSLKTDTPEKRRVEVALRKLFGNSPFSRRSIRLGKLVARTGVFDGATFSPEFEPIQFDHFPSIDEAWEILFVAEQQIDAVIEECNKRTLVAREEAHQETLKAAMARAASAEDENRKILDIVEDFCTELEYLSFHVGADELRSLSIQLRTLIDDEKEN
jgi:aspartate-semialdehyde dehydrogenase